MSNSVTVFSNGIADFIHSYPIKKGEKLEISIPVKKSHVGDVLASLNIFGDVKLEYPPSFSPQNNLDGDLQIDTSNVLCDLATKLSGCKISVDLFATEKATKGILMGVHTQELVADNLQSHEYSLIVLTEDGIVRLAFEEIANIFFDDETVQSEINKALQRNFQTVKPNSTFVDLSVIGTGDKDLNAYVQYTVPAAAWKITYRLNKDGDNYTLKGLAIVDNNTEEDWKDVNVSVVTGEPITFSTDLAESKTPLRSHVNIVNNKAVGNVEVERGMSRKLSTKSAAPMAMMACAGNAPVRSMGLEACFDSDSGDSDNWAPVRSAMTSDTEIKEVGDYSIFKSKNPLTILSNRSAIIPVFDAELKETKNILHYNSKNNESRAYRSLHFKNETEHSLGRGVCTVFFDGIYSGSAVLPAAKIGQDNLMPYSLETGVKIMKNLSSSQNKLSNIKIAAGTLVSEQITISKYNYTFENSKQEDFEVYLDHECYKNDNNTVKAKLGNKEIHVDKNLSNGLRFKVKLNANSTTEVVITETLLNQTSFFVTNNINWFISSYVTSGPLVNNDIFEEVIKINNQISEIKEKITKANDKSEKLAAKQIRLRENLKVGGSDEKRSNWVSELDDCENKISKIEEIEIPAHQNELESLNKKLENSLKSVTLNWTNDA